MKNDITIPRGFSAYFMQQLEPRIKELADLTAANKGKTRIHIPVKTPIEVTDESKESTLWRSNTYLGGGIYKKRTGVTRIDLYIPEWEA
jgi:hypothetical protein